MSCARAMFSAPAPMPTTSSVVSGAPSWSVLAPSNEDELENRSRRSEPAEEGGDTLVGGVVELAAEGFAADLEAVLQGASAEKRSAIASLSAVGPTERHSTAKRASGSRSSSAPENL